MDHATEVALIKRIFAHDEAGTKDMAAASTRTPVAEYTDPDRHAREVELFFRDAPLMVGHASQAARPGDFFTHDETGVPILVTRDDTGALNAFVNVCRHRGAVVCAEKAGSGRRAFVCPYHAWTYGADGKLTGQPDAAGFDDVERAEMGLTRLPVSEKYGFVWVRPRPDLNRDAKEDLDIEAFLGPIAPDFAAMDLGSHAVFASEKHPAPVPVRQRMNWKLMVDTFLEAYHFKYAHPKSVYPLFLDNLGLYERFEPHIRWVMPKRTMRDLRGTDEAGWRLRDHSFVMHYVYPNTMFVAVEDHVASFAHFPRGPDEAVLLLSLYIPEPPKSAKAQAHWEANQDMLLGAIAEDFTIGEGMQRGFRSCAQECLTYGRFEHALGWFHDTVNQALAAAGHNQFGE